MSRVRSIIPLILILSLSIAIGGCVEIDESLPPGPGPSPDLLDVAAAADQGMLDYREQSARAAEELADRVDSIRSAGDFDEQWGKANQEARGRAFEGFARSVNERLYQRDGSWDTERFDPTKAREVLIDAAKGFRGGK